VALSVICNPTKIPDPERFCDCFKMELADYHKIAHDRHEEEAKVESEELEQEQSADSSSAGDSPSIGRKSSGRSLRTKRRQSIQETHILGLTSGFDHQVIPEADGVAKRRHSTLTGDLFNGKAPIMLKRAGTSSSGLAREPTMQRLPEESNESGESDSSAWKEAG
jgi:hypothetical protein